MGNFLFVEPYGRFSAVLDWELAHLGDFHEDLAYTMQKGFGTRTDSGDFLVCDLMPPEQFIENYEALSGRHVDLATLRYYEALVAWKLAVIVRASAARAASEGTNHQDLLISWLSMGSAMVLDELPNILLDAI